MDRDGAPSNKPEEKYEIKEKLNKALKDGNQEDFIKLMEKNIDLINGEMETGETYLYYCCSYELEEAGKFLIQNVSDDVVITADGTSNMTPLEMASYMGNHELVKCLLLKRDNLQKKNEMFFNRIICISFCNVLQHKSTEYEECVEQFLKVIHKYEIDTEIHKDCFDKTVMEYARYFGFSNVIISLRKEIHDGMNPDVVTKYFDTLIKIKQPNDNKSKDDGDITFSCKYLCHFDENSISEIDEIWYLRHKKKFEQLFLHPVTMCILWCKWLKIKKYYYTEMSLYIIIFAILYCTTLITDVCRTYVFTGIALLFSVVEVFVYILYLCTCWKKCRRTNKLFWISLICEIFMSSVNIVILIFKIVELHGLKKLLCVPILIVTIKLVLLSRVISIYGELLRVVLWNTLKILLMFCCLFLFVSTLYFSILDENVITSDDNNYTIVSKIFYKMFVLLVGELKDDNISQPNKIFLLGFIILFSIVCANLLNGLTVYDTNLLKKNALIVTQSEMAKYVHFIESFSKSFENKKVSKRCENLKIFNDNSKKEIKAYFSRSNEDILYTELGEDIKKSLSEFINRSNKENACIYECFVEIEKTEANSYSLCSSNGYSP